MMRHTYLCAAVLLAFVLAGCGQNGPLYLPGNPSEMKVPPQAPQESSDEQDEDEARDNIGNES